MFHRLTCLLLMNNAGWMGPPFSSYHEAEGSDLSHSPKKRGMLLPCPRTHTHTHSLTSTPAPTLNLVNKVKFAVLLSLSLPHTEEERNIWEIRVFLSHAGVLL
ncbi:Hypothetical predicted protein [Xyrichtys novacula]|uniref:Secreted protein n=1 Tax=Xyrichtys novacula TaxID=13765 RepID=A0AAV1FEF6_XYRNO|nr:Hypothetical predicted protein [Xyrichtys novacula]